MGNTRDTGHLRDIITYDGSNNVTLPGTLKISGTKNVATEEYVGTQVAALVASAPDALNTLNELAAAINNDAGFASTLSSSLSGKQGTITLTTTGTSGTASFSGNTLNIPNYANNVGSSGTSGSSGSAGTSGSAGSSGSSGSTGTSGSSGSSGSTGSSGTSGAGTISNGTSGYVAKFTGATTLSNSLIYDNGSGIGINTTSPGGVIDIQSSNAGNALHRFWNTDTSGTGSSSVRIANSGNTNDGSRIEFTDNSYYVATISGDRTQGIVFRTGATGTSPTGISERMRINPSGAVSIINGLTVGTTSTNNIITVNGDSTSGIEIKTNSAGGRIAALEQYFGTEGYLGLYVSNVEKIRLRANGFSFLNNGSNFAIGTGTDPGYKFHVATSSQVASYFYTTSTYAPIAWSGDGGTTKGGVIAHSGVVAIGPLNSGGTGVDGNKAINITSSAGYVGLGGSSSNVALTITTPGDTADGTFYSTFTINNTGASTFSRVRFDRSGVAKWGLTLASDDTFRISNLYENGTVTANDATLSIKNNNFVGIGTANPSARLQIIGGNTAEGQLYVGNTDVTYSAGINFYTSTTNRGFVGWRHTNSGAPFSLTGIHLINTDNSNIVLGTNNTVKAVLNVDGNFGIGITSPAHKLSVNGNAKFIITPGASSDGDRLTIAQNNGTYGLDLVAYGSGANPYNSSQGIFSWGGYDLLVMSNNANIKFVTASYTERMRITNGGQVLMYNQPAFMAYGNGNSSIDPSNGTYLIYPSVHLNRGSHYNASNGIFTAPVAGAYLFSWSDIGGNANEVYRFFLRVNDSTFLSDYHLRLDTNATGSEYGTNGNRTAIVNLSANDTVRIWFRNDGGNSMYGTNDTVNSYHNFMGYLIG